MLQSGVVLTTFSLVLKKKKVCPVWGVRQLIPKLPSNITVPFVGQDLVPVTSAKDLGVTLNSNVTFSGHIASLTSSLLSTLVQMNRIRYSFSKDVLYIILHSVVFSNCSIARPYGLQLLKKRSISYNFCKTLEETENLSVVC